MEGGTGDSRAVCAADGRLFGPSVLCADCLPTAVLPIGDSSFPFLQFLHFLWVFLIEIYFLKVLYFLLLSINEWMNDRMVFQSKDATMYHPSWHVKLLFPSLFGFMALPKSSLLRILASLSLYLEIRRNSFSSDQYNPLPANLHQHRPSDISTSLFHTFFFLLHNIYFQLIATFHVGPRWLLISFLHSPFLPLSQFLLRLIYLIICNALQPC